MPTPATPPRCEGATYPVKPMPPNHEVSTAPGAEPSVKTSVYVFRMRVRKASVCASP